jgi:lysyl-tRNA synthetase class 2
LKSVGFDQKARVLEIQFHHGGIYRYHDVPAETHAALMKAESKGKYFQANIRNKFRFERVSSEK